MEQLSGISASNVGNVETVQHLNDYFKDISNNHLVNPFIPSKITPKKINHNPVFVDPKIMKILQFNPGIMQIIKIISFHLIIMKIMEII